MQGFGTGREFLRELSVETEEDCLRVEHGVENCADSLSQPFDLLPANVKAEYAEVMTKAKHMATPEKEPFNKVSYLELEDSLLRVLQSTPILSTQKSDGYSDKASSHKSEAPNGEEEPGDELCYLELEDSFQRVLQSTRIFSLSESDDSSDKDSSHKSGTLNDFLRIPEEKNSHSSIWIGEEDAFKPSTECKEVQCSIRERKSIFRGCIACFGMLLVCSIACNVYLFTAL